MLIDIAAPNRVFRKSLRSLRSLNSDSLQKLTVPRRPRALSATLPFERLTPYELVRTQFSPWGIEFEEAIALYPSNPRFNPVVSSPVVMPMASTLKINLLKPQRSVRLRLRGHHDIRFKTLDAKGRAIACKKLFSHRYTEAGKAPQESLTLDLHQVCTLMLTSSAPFVLESFRF